MIQLCGMVVEVLDHDEKDGGRLLLLGYGRIWILAWLRNLSPNWVPGLFSMSTMTLKGTLTPAASRPKRLYKPLKALELLMNSRTWASKAEAVRTPYSPESERSAWWQPAWHQAMPHSPRPRLFQIVEELGPLTLLDEEPSKIPTAAAHVSTRRLPSGRHHGDKEEDGDLRQDTVEATSCHLALRESLRMGECRSDKVMGALSQLRTEVATSSSLYTRGS